MILVSAHKMECHHEANNKFQVQKISHGLHKQLKQNSVLWQKIGLHCTHVQEIESKGSRLTNLVEKISRQLHIQAVIWVNVVAKNYKDSGKHGREEILEQVKFWPKGNYMQNWSQKDVIAGEITTSEKKQSVLYKDIHAAIQTFSGL